MEEAPATGETGTGEEQQKGCIQGERIIRGLGIAKAHVVEQGEEKRRGGRDHSSGFDSILGDRNQGE